MLKYTIRKGPSLNFTEGMSWDEELKTLSTWLEQPYQKIQTLIAATWVQQNLMMMNWKR